MDYIDKYERKYQDSAYYRLPNDIIKNYRASSMFQNSLTVSSGYRTGPNTLYGFNVRKQPSSEHLIKLCVEGEAWLEVDGQRESIKPGDLLIVHSQTKHAYGTTAANPWSVYWVYFHCDFLDDLLPGLAEKKYMILPITDDLAVTNHLKTIISHMKRGYAMPYQYAATARLHVLLSFIQNLLNNRTTSDQHSFDAIVEYMSDNLDITLDIQTIAAMSGLSKDHFIRLFHKRYGFTPLDYFIRLKLQRACEMLLSTDQPIKNIALSLGYKDYYYFSRVFKQKMALSPKEYRATNAI